MSKITLDNLSDNLKAYLEGLGLSEEQVLNLINENGLNEEELKAMLKDTMSINELSTNSKTVIGAINELFQNANNGKQLIANAIGEPVSAEDTFSAMSNDINGLLSTFKTNMMNNGVTVESGDKFKSLIDKIATLADSGNKGVKYYRGTTPTFTVSSTNKTGNLIVPMNLDFTPTFIWFAPYAKALVQSELNYSRETAVNLTAYFWITNITDKSFTINYDYNNNGSNYNNTEFIAIGVGEEDTTLRDSLASILENKGLDVTEEDDMASLITKVEGLVEIPGFIKQGCWMTAPIATNPNKDYNMSTMVAIGDNIHVMGGHPGDSNVFNNGTNNHYAYNVKTDTWIQLASLPDNRQRTISIAVNDGIYNTGGTDNSYRGQNTTYYYDSILNSWTTKAAMPDFKYNHAFTSFGNKLFITGGSDSVDNYGDKTFIYDILTDTWTQKTNYPSNNGIQYALTIDSDRILVFTGGSSGYYYIPSTDTWTVIQYSRSTGNARSRLAFSSKNGKAYFANADNMLSMDFSNINNLVVEVISICQLENSFGDVVEVDGNIYHMYGYGDDNTMIIGII